MLPDTFTSKNKSTFVISILVNLIHIYQVMRNSTQRVNKILYIFSPQTLPRESSLREALDIRILIMDSHSNTQV